MTTKSFSPSRNALLGFLSLIIPVLMLFIIRSPAPLAYLILWIKWKIIVTTVAIVCIFLGVLGLKKFKESKPTPITRIVCILGISLCIALSYYVWSIKLPKVTGVISRIQVYEQGQQYFGYTRALDVRPDEPVPDSLKGDHYQENPIFAANTTWDTLILKQTGGRLTRIINQNQLEINQHIEIEYSGWVYLTDPSQIDAIVIRILDR